jgi:hypothetical protein
MADRTTHLYRVRFDGQMFYVEAPGFATAIEVWHAFVKHEWGKDYDGSRQPDSVELLDSDHDVIRWPFYPPAPAQPPAPMPNPSAVTALPCSTAPIEPPF